MRPHIKSCRRFLRSLTPSVHAADESTQFLLMDTPQHALSSLLAIHFTVAFVADVSGNKPEYVYPVIVFYKFSSLFDVS